MEITFVFPQIFFKPFLEEGSSQFGPSGWLMSPPCCVYRPLVVRCSVNPDKLDHEFTRRVKHLSLSGCVQQGHSPSVSLVIVLGLDLESQTLPAFLCLLLLGIVIHTRNVQ